MSSIIDVAVPELAIDVLVYYDVSGCLVPGQRIIVQVQKTLHVGFVIGRSTQLLPKNIKIKPVEGIIDAGSVIEPDIWDMALWSGRVSMCGVNASLRGILPRPLIMGERLTASPPHTQPNRFHELNCFNPFDAERVNFYVSELLKPERTLMLFPTREAAKTFYHKLPYDLKAVALLWPSRGIWEAWKHIYAKDVRIVIGSPGAVFAPLMPERIIIEDEANPGYMLPKAPNISARSLAGRRAMTLGAELVTGGKMPSLKTYIRTKPTPSETPERKNIVLADIYHSRKETEHGIEGSIPLTFSLVKRTLRELLEGHNVLWILGRQGKSSEVFCDNCGQSVRCPKCNNIMRSLNDGDMLKCHVCSHVCELPKRCPNCGSDLFMGKRPGIEALAEIASKHYPKVKLYVKGARKTDMKGLIISTQRGLELLGSVNISLVAWLDLDMELWKPEHDTRYKVYMMLYETYYRGLKRGSTRTVLIQARKDGIKLAGYLSEGWGKFIPYELKSREELMLPPYSYIVELETTNRNKVINLLEDAGLFVMDSGEDDTPLYVITPTLEAVRKVIAPNTKIKITVRSE